MQSGATIACDPGAGNRIGMRTISVVPLSRVSTPSSCPDEPSPPIRTLRAVSWTSTRSNEEQDDPAPAQRGTARSRPRRSRPEDGGPRAPVMSSSPSRLAVTQVRATSSGAASSFWTCRAWRPLDIGGRHARHRAAFVPRQIGSTRLPVGLVRDEGGPTPGQGGHLAQVLLERFENAPGSQRSTSLHQHQRIDDGLVGARRTATMATRRCWQAGGCKNARGFHRF